MPKPRESTGALRLTPMTFQAARIKRNTKSQQVKFKVRCQRFVYTLALKDSVKSDKLKQSLPPGMSSPTFSFIFAYLFYFGAVRYTCLREEIITHSHGLMVLTDESVPTSQLCKLSM